MTNAEQQMRSMVGLPPGYITRINCLDKGFVELVNFTSEPDLFIAQCAKVDPHADWRHRTIDEMTGKENFNDERLINHLVKNKHSTPIEKVDFVFHVKAPIFVYRQWHRHRTQSYNEESARYKVMKPDFYYPDPENIGQQSKKNHQGRELETKLSDHDLHLIRGEVLRVERHCKETYILYEKLLKGGWPRELARMVLPVNLYSEMIAKANLWNWFKFLELRLDPHAQYEIRVYAEAILELITPLAPETVAAWLDSIGGL